MSRTARRRPFWTRSSSGSSWLAPFGLDARDPAFWQIGLGMIERLIGELEAMEKAVG